MSTPAGAPRPSFWALWPTLGATWIALAQVLSFQGLAIWVVGGSIVCALAVFGLSASHRRFLAVITLVVVTVLVAVAADRVGGESAGPITRAALMSAAIAGVMALLLTTRYPAAILATSLVYFSGVLGLGAADATLWLVGLWAVAAAVTLTLLGPYSNEDLRQRSRLRQFALLIGLVGAVSIIVMVVLAPLIDDPWSLPSATSADSPSTTDPSVLLDAPSVDDGASPETIENSAPPWYVLFALATVALLTAAILVAFLRRVCASAMWSRERRRLSRGSHEESTAGAWQWVILRRARYDCPLPVSASPDVAVEWAARAQEPDVLAVARIVGPMAFNPNGRISRTEQAQAWTAARAAGKVPAAASFRQRWKWGARTPRQIADRLRSSPEAFKVMRGH